MVTLFRLSQHINYILKAVDCLFTLPFMMSASIQSCLPDTVTKWLPATFRATHFTIHIQIGRASPFSNHQMSFLNYSQ